MKTLTLPSSKAVKKIEATREKRGLRVSNPSGTTIRELVRPKRVTDSRQDEKLKGHIYRRFSCSLCSSAYIGETGRGLRVRLREHLRDFKYDVSSNALVQHSRKTAHFPDWTLVSPSKIYGQTQTKGIGSCLHSARIEFAEHQSRIFLLGSGRR